MKFNKKVLIGLLTASCVVAGTFGLAACQGGEQEEHKPEVTVGANGNLYVDGVDTGYKVQDDNVGETVTIDYVLQTPTGVFVYYSDGTSAEVPYVMLSLSLSDENEIVLPENGKTTYLCVEIPEGSAGAYTFELGFSGLDNYSDYTFTVNGKEFTVGGGLNNSFNAQLNEGTNLITVTSNLIAESSATLSIKAIPAGGTLSVGDNDLSFEESDTFYSYTFTAEEDGDYILTLAAVEIGASSLCITDINGEIILSEEEYVGNYDTDWVYVSSDPVTLTANETVTFLIKAYPDENGEIDETFELNIEKFVPPTVNADDEEAATVTISPDGTTVVLNAETAGTHVLTIQFSALTGYSQIIVNGNTANILSATSNTIELELEAGENVITLALYGGRQPMEFEVTLTSGALEAE